MKKVPDILKVNCYGKLNHSILTVQIEVKRATYHNIQHAFQMV